MFLPRTHEPDPRLRTQNLPALEAQLNYTVFIPHQCLGSLFPPLSPSPVHTYLPHNPYAFSSCSAVSSDSTPLPLQNFSSPVFASYFRKWFIFWSAGLRAQKSSQNVVRTACRRARNFYMLIHSTGVQWRGFRKSSANQLYYFMH